LDFLENYKQIDFSKRVAAVFCVYEDSGYLEEAIWRAYPFVDLIIISVGKRPWSGKADNCNSPALTLASVCRFFDPQKKIEIHFRDFEDESSQRNFEKEYCYRYGYDWILIIDDDEFYNPRDLVNLRKSLQDTSDLVVLVPQRIYWKSKDYVIKNIVTSLPVAVRCDMSRAWFNFARNVLVARGGWHTLSPKNAVYHHFSYARSDDQLLRKVRNFSHAGEHDFEDWFKNIWLKWTPSSLNLHPNPFARDSFEKAISSTELTDSERLQNSGLNIKSKLYKTLKASDLERLPSDFSQKFHLKSIHNFVYKICKTLGASAEQCMQIAIEFTGSKALNCYNFELIDNNAVDFYDGKIYIAPLTDSLYKKIENDYAFFLMPYFENPYVIFESI
jgi:hypothetical protein